MTTDEKIWKDVLWGMYQENVIQGRHHETQRATVTGAIIAFASLLLNGVNADKLLDKEDIYLTILLCLIGLFGAIFSLKQYERYLLHTRRARGYRKMLDNLMFNGVILVIKEFADKAQEEEFPRLSNLKLHYMWIGINLCVAIIGFALSWTIIT